MNYPEHPGYARNSDTSKEAAKHVEASGERELRWQQIMRLLEAHEPDGHTNDEMQLLTGMPMQSVSARMRELVLAGEVYDTDVRRLTRYGRKATVRRPVTKKPEP